MNGLAHTKRMCAWLARAPVGTHEDSRNQIMKTHHYLIAIIALAGLPAVFPAHGAGPSREDELANRHSDPLAQIGNVNVTQLRLAWKIETETPVTHQPLVQDGRIYFADWSGGISAADAKTGKVLWQKAVEQPMTNWPWHGFCGTGTLGEGMLFEASAEGNAFAVDTQSGAVKWKTRFVGDEKNAGNCGTIFYQDDLVFIGVSSVEEGLALQIKGFEVKFRGSVVALNATTGKEAWRLSLVAPPANGVPVWSSFALDAATGTLFFTTGNNYTGKGTKFSDAIIAVDAKTGKVRWSRQFTEQDVWTMAQASGPDYDFGSGPQLFEGTNRKLVGAGQKSGVYHALDRNTGEIVWQTTVGYGEIGGGIMADAAVKDGKVFVWSNNSYQPKSRKADETPMTIKAVDAATGIPSWILPKAQPAGVTSAGFVSEDVFFAGSLDGRVRAYSAKDGKTLWSSPEGQASVGSSLTVSGDTLYFGAGVPKVFGGNDQGGNGVFAYKVGATPPGKGL